MAPIDNALAGWRRRLGPMELKPKVAKERKKPERKEKQVLEDVVRWAKPVWAEVNPELVDADVNKSTSETEKLMRQVAKVLSDRKGAPIDALHLVFNKKCFAQARNRLPPIPTAAPATSRSPASHKPTTD